MYQSRISADPDYVQSIGRAFYNFTYLEWVAIWTIVRLRGRDFDSVPRGASASAIAKALVKAIEETVPPLPDRLRKRLIRFHESYVASIRTRNKLLHAHPYTAAGGAQELGGGCFKWPTHAVDEAAQSYEMAALEGSDIFHGDLAKVRK